jgi:CelD/BcsL family acetyltransferase involved in cellulose biosynthesis
VHVDLIARYQDFVALREQWDAVYDADPDAQVFLSWSWMATWLERREVDGGNAGGWVILVAKASPEATTCLAILPLRCRSGEAGGAPRLTMAGRRFADYSGILCRPEAQREAIPALAECVKRIRWQRWQLEFLRCPPEVLTLLLQSFPATAFSVAETKTINEGEDTDNSICPYIDLPESWDEFLMSRLSANCRQKLRRLLRTVESSSELHITHATPATIERDIRILLQLWKNRWQERKGEKLQAILQLNATILYRNFEDGSVYLPILWHGRRPVGALAFLIDGRKGAIHFCIAGRDQSFNQPSPGLVLHAHSIRVSIERGIRTYDFLRGNEPYKYSFGAHDRTVRSLVITRRSRVV